MIENIVTVEDLIKHLSKFDPKSKLCFWDDGGTYMNIEYATKSFFDKYMFRCIKDIKKDTSYQEDEEYDKVEENSILIF